MHISHDLASLSKIINQQSNEKIDSPLASREFGSKFDNVLKDLLSNTQSTSLDSSSLKTLNKEQLMLFSKALQIQMNSRLYNTLFNNALESNILATQIMQNYRNNIDHFGSNVSKNDRNTSKMTPFKGDANLDRIINQASNKYDIDSDLIRAVIKAESNGNPAATSSKGAMGLMQLMPETARELGVKNAYDAEENVMGGTRYLKMLLSRYDGQVDLALAAYNWGMGNLEKNPDRLPTETVGYIAKINAYYKNVKA